MKEEFLHYAWKHGLFERSGLQTVTGDPIIIKEYGSYNRDSGPDFFNAKISIGGLVWVGNVEIHIRSSDWKRHGHSDDKAYENVILHVVFEDDEKKMSRSMATLELKNILNSGAIQRSEEFDSSLERIPCGSQLSSGIKIDLSPFTEELIEERLSSRSKRIFEKLMYNMNNWEETFYHSLAASFGFRINAHPFEALARSIPLSMFGKQKGNRFHAEALLFGQSGMLSRKFKEAYPKKMRKEYAYLSKKHTLTPDHSFLWKFLRMRPSNFPTIRISQFAGLMVHQTGLFSVLLEAGTVNELHSVFETGVSDYWEEHYVFGQRTKRQKKILGRSAIDSLIINLAVPFLFAYGRSRAEKQFVERSIRFLHTITAEDNSILRHWNKLGFACEDAFRSQALLELKKNYCDRKRCLDCAIGLQLLRK